MATAATAATAANAADVVTPRTRQKLLDARVTDRISQRILRRRHRLLAKHWSLRYSRKERRSLIRNPWQRPVVTMHLAATSIQAVVRKYAMQLRYGFRLRPPKTVHPPKHETKPISPSKYKYKSMHHIAARLIANWYRKVGSHHNFQMYHIAATELQLWFTSKKAEPSIRAAYKIQHCYQSFANRRIYRYYRDLLEFQNKGDPKLMLRSINPGEASLFDKSTNVCVRFRLGGPEFPPTIYYKIFTRSAVCDIGAFAPRDYTQETTDGDVTKLHNRPKPEDEADSAGLTVRVGQQNFGAALKGGESIDTVDQSSWYQRVDRNGWRSVTAKTLTEAAEDPVTKATAARKTKFHYSKVKRREDLAAKRKRRKRKWMLELYRNGLAKEKIRGQTLIVDPDLPEEELPAVDFDNNNWEEDADALLEWTSGLDFDQYLDGWSQLATSALTTDKEEIGKSTKFTDHTFM